MSLQREPARSAPPRVRPLARAARLRFRVDKRGEGALPYELLLEMDGTLKSWAVPNAPDEQACETARLAVVAQGERSSGLEAWDEGTWIPRGEPVASYRRGKLEFELRGRRLTGRWALVRTGNAQTRKKGLWVLKKLEQ
jgi:bifunctional non-homologous end joining protein LigD